MFSAEHLVLLVVALLGLAAAVYGFTRWRPRSSRDGAEVETQGAPEPAPTAPTILRRSTLDAEGTRHPILLAHGWFGFDVIALPGVRHDYFRGVREHLEGRGHRVYVSRVAPAASVRRRAAQLAEQVDRMGFDKVNIIAHSMGGLDARYAISRLGLAARVASLTTIGTPHHGTPLADTSLLLGNWSRTRWLLSGLGTHIDGIYDLTTEHMLAFNDEIEDIPGVAYASYVGSVWGGVRNVHTLLAPGFTYLRRRAGDNDGIVPASSQRWGRVLGELHADHWAQIGWSRGVDVRSFYGGVARMLARRGF